MKKNILPILILLFITGCGFKVVNQSDLINFSISEIKMSGDKRINYNIKNKLLSSLTNDKNRSVVLKMDTNKKKVIKDKNIKNQVTRYQITIIVIVEIKDDAFNNMNSFKVESNGDYDVATQYSQTLNNEKNLIKTLSENLADEIVEELILKLNDI